MPERVEAAPRHRNLAWSDFRMLIGPGGRPRSGVEFRALLRAADFKSLQSDFHGGGVQYSQSSAGRYLMILLFYRRSS